MSDQNQIILAAISDASRLTGVSARYLHATAQRESNFDPEARAATSSAAGLYQFIESTWLETLSRHGAALGVSADLAPEAQGDPREAALALRFDPRAAALMAGALARDNAASLEAHLGREPDAGELYAAHVLGASGAATLFEAVQTSPDLAAAEAFPRAAEANYNLFYDGEGAPVSVAALANRLTGMVSDAAAPVPALRRARDSEAQLALAVAPAPVRTVMLRGASAPLRLSAPVVEALARLDAPESARSPDEDRVREPRETR